MHLRLFCLAALCVAAVNSASWGEQRAQLSKNAKTVNAVQTGTRNNGNFKANAANEAAITAEHKGRPFKTGLLRGQNTVQAGSRRQDEYTAKKASNSLLEAKTVRGQTADVKLTGRTGADVQAPDRRGRKQQVNTKLQGTNTNAKIPGANKVYDANYNQGSKKFEVKDAKTGSQVANGVIKPAGGRDSYNVPIQYGKSTVLASDKKSGRISDASATVRDSNRRINKKYNSKTSDGSITKTEVGTGGIFGSGYTELDKPRRESKVGGSLVRGPVLSVKDRGSKKQECPRPRNGAYEWNGGQFKIDDKNVKLRPPNTNERGGNMNVKWPDCVTMEVPMTFPAGTKIENLAVSLKVLLPGCNQVLCAGYICGNPGTAQLGYAEETCWEDDLCKYNPPKGNARGSILGASLKNSKNDACQQGYNGGPLNVKFTFCAMNDDKLSKEKHCSIVNLAELFGQGSDRSQIQAITTVYEKINKNGGGSGGLGQISSWLSNGITKTLTQCNKADYDAKGCYELAQDYQISAFGLTQDTHSFMKTGVNRGVSNKNTNNNNRNSNRNTNNNRNTNIRTTPRPSPSTRRNIFSWFTTAAPAAGGNKPWWQRGRR